MMLVGKLMMVKKQLFLLDLALGSRSFQAVAKKENKRVELEVFGFQQQKVDCFETHYHFTILVYHLNQGSDDASVGFTP